MVYEPAIEEVRFFIDGETFTTNYGVRNPPIEGDLFTVPMTVGAFSSSSGFIRPYFGSLSHVCLFDRSLNQAEASAHHRAGSMPIAVQAVQTSDHAHPDSPGDTALGLGLAVATGNTGRQFSINVASLPDPVHTRVTIRPDALTAGSVTVLRAMDANERPVAWLRVHSDRTLTLHSSTATTAAIALPAPLPWFTIELGINTASSTIEAHIDGVLASSTTIPPGESVARFDLGAVDCRNASGQIYFDDWVIADAAIGPLLVAPNSDHADDPARWLVVYRRDQPESVAWADAYRQARAVPLGNLLGLVTPDEEVVDTSAYDQLRAAIGDRLGVGHLADQLMGVLLGPGIPGLVDVLGDGTLAWPLATGLQANTDPVELVVNPLGNGTLERPTHGSLVGHLITARIDGDAPLTHALAQFAALNPLGSTEPRPLLYIDPYGDPDLDNTHTQATESWAKSVEARSLGLTTRLTTPQARSFKSLNNDAIYFGYEAGPPTSAFFGSSSTRRMFVQAEMLQPPLQTLRTDRQTHWSGTALDAGYAVSATATSPYSPSFAPQPDRLFPALRAGWTVGEAWHVAQPVLGNSFQLIGDPLTTASLPKDGYRVYGPAASLAEAMNTPPSDALPAGADGWAPAEDWLWRDGEGVLAITSVDASGRENRVVEAIRLTRRATGYAVPMTRPVWPRKSNWPLDENRTARIVWDCQLRDCSIARVALERQEFGGAIDVETEVDATRVRSYFLEHQVSDISAGSRWRWRLTDGSEASLTTPWSRWVEPAGLTPAGPSMEANR